MDNTTAVLEVSTLSSSAGSQSTGVNEEEYLSDTFVSLLFWINAVVVPAFGFLGIVLNTLGVLTLTYMGVNTSSTLYMLIICVGDSISGFVDAILSVGIGVWFTNLYVLGRGWCKAGMWINYATTCSTQFVLTLFTFDRLLAVSMPIKYRSLKANLRYAGLSSALVVLLTYISLLGHFYAFELVDGQCTRPSYMSELGKLLYFHYSASFVYCGLPSSLIFMFNLAILYFMRKQNNNSKAGGGGANSALRTEREQAITRILLLMSFAFLIFTAIAMVFLYYTQLYLAPQLEDGQPRVGQLYVALRQLAELPATWNVSFNFTFYLAGSRIFRKGFTDMLQSYFCCRKPNGNPSNQ